MTMLLSLATATHGMPNFADAAGAALPANPAGRYRLSGRDLLDPSGTPVRIFGMNEGHSVFDTGYFLPTDPALFTACKANFVRLELHTAFGQVDPAYTYPGSVDLFDASHPETGFLNPDRLERAFDIIEAFTSAGFLVGPAWHSKYLRINFPTDAAAVAKFIAHQVYFFGHPRIRLNPLVIWGEHLNEPDPATGGQAALTALYLAIIAAVRAVHPDLINMVGPKGGYASGQLPGAYIPGLTNVGYAVDLFVQGNADDQNANQVQRIGDVTSFRETFAAFTFSDQTGGTFDADSTGAYTQSLVQRQIDADLDLAYWECTRPGAGGGNFHAPQTNDGVNPPTTDAAQIALLAGWGATAAARRGLSRN